MDKGLSLNRLEKYAIAFLRAEIEEMEKVLESGSDFPAKKQFESLLNEYRSDLDKLMG